MNISGVSLNLSVWLRISSTLFCCVFASLSSGTAMAQMSEASNSVKLQGKVEMMDLEDTSVRGTQSQYWCAHGTSNFNHGKVTQAVKDFQKALNEADNSKLTSNQKALITSNLASAQRVKGDFQQASALFKKALELMHVSPDLDEKLESYISTQKAMLTQEQDNVALKKMAPGNGKTAAAESNGKLTGEHGLEELSLSFGKLKVPTKIDPLDGTQLPGKIFSVGAERKKSDKMAWHRIPHDLAGSWHCSDVCTTTRMEDLSKMIVSYTAPSASNLLHTADEIEGKQSDSRGDIWDVDEFPMTEEVSDPKPGTKGYFRTTFAKTVTVDPKLICSLYQFDNVTTSSSDNRILNRDRYLQLYKMALVDKNTVKISVVDIAFDNNGVPTQRHDYYCLAKRAKPYADNDAFKPAFVDFLNSQKLKDLLPRSGS